MIDFRIFFYTKYEKKKNRYCLEYDARYNITHVPKANKNKKNK